VGKSKKSKKKKVSGRGGARRGAGRKPKPEGEKMVSISFALLPELRDQIDERRRLEGVGRSELLRRYSQEGLARKPKLRKQKGSKTS